MERATAGIMVELLVVFVVGVDIGLSVGLEVGNLVGAGVSSQVPLRSWRVLHPFFAAFSPAMVNVPKNEERTGLLVPPAKHRTASAALVRS